MASLQRMGAALTYARRYALFTLFTLRCARSLRPATADGGCREGRDSRDSSGPRRPAPGEGLRLLPRTPGNGRLRAAAKPASAPIFVPDKGFLFPWEFYCCIFSAERTIPMAQTKARPASAADQAAVLTKATLNAATRLGLTNKLLATVIGVSEATVSRMRNGVYKLQRGQKSFELAVLFVRLYRSLDAIVGGDDAVAGVWLKNRNTALDAEPLALIQTVPGLMNVIQYLDARRAIV
jgi:hypothetical protein